MLCQRACGKITAAREKEEKECGEEVRVPQGIKMKAIAAQIIERLKEKGLTLGVVESATGGLISHTITSVPGASSVYKGSVTAYANQIKTDILGVSTRSLAEFGAVSATVAEEMALGGCRVLDVDICLSDTGIAGPGGETVGKPVGLFFFGLGHKTKAFSKKRIFHGTRDQNKVEATNFALELLGEFLSLEQNLKRIDSPKRFRVVTSFLEQDGRILLLKRSAHVGTYKGRWAAISGFVESYPQTQSLLEIQEEIGLESGDVELSGSVAPFVIDDAASGLCWVIHAFYYKIKSHAKIRIDPEHSEYEWVEPNDIKNYDTVPGLIESFERVTKGGEGCVYGGATEHRASEKLYTSWRSNCTPRGGKCSRRVMLLSCPSSPYISTTLHEDA